MADEPPAPWQARIASHLRQPQHRNAYYLMLNGVTGAAAGLLFWLLMARVLALPPRDIGLGSAIVSLGTLIGVLAKGGLDTALIRHVPAAGQPGGRSLLRFAVAASVACALAFTLVAASFALAGAGLTELTVLDWSLVAAIAALLATTWLQDAYFLAEGDARFSFQRNLVLCAGRLLLPIPVVLLGWPQPVALSWGIALAASAAAALGFSRRVRPRPGRVPVRKAFVRTATRNLSGSAAEFLPGLVLPPLVLAASGAEQAAYFSIAWAAASLLFLASAAVSRSALAELVKAEPPAHAGILRRAVLLNLAVVAPLAILGMAVAPIALGLFGSAYAHNGAATFAILCASAFAVAPAYLYLAVLRASDRSAALILFPAAMTAALLVLAPWFAAGFGIGGVALAWLLSNVPFGLYAAWQLRGSIESSDARPSVLVAEHEMEVHALG